MAPYLTPAQIATRLLDRFSIAATVTPGDADIASDELDALGPFVGVKETAGQVREWPRVLSDGIGPAVTPEAVKDWIALRAYQLSSDEDPAITRETILDASWTYAEPKLSTSQKRMSYLLAPFLATADGSTEGSSTMTVASTWSTG